MINPSPDKSCDQARALWSHLRLRHFCNQTYVRAVHVRREKVKRTKKVCSFGPDTQLEDDMINCQKYNKQEGKLKVSEGQLLLDATHLDPRDLDR